MNKSPFIDKINLQQIRNDLVDPKVGDINEVISKTFDRNGKMKLSTFKGTVISVERKKSIDRCFTIIDHSGTMVINKKVFTNSPLIVEIKKIGTAVRKVRRARINYHEKIIAEKKRNS